MEDQRNQTADVRPGVLRDSLGTQPAVYARYLILANGIGLAVCLGVMSQLGGYAPARDILTTSAMALGLGAAAGTLAYSVFPVARRYEAAAEALERQAGDNAREKRRAEKKMKTALSFRQGGGQLLIV